MPSSATPRVNRREFREVVTFFRVVETPQHFVPRQTKTVLFRTRGKVTRRSQAVLRNIKQVAAQNDGYYFDFRLPKQLTDEQLPKSNDLLEWRGRLYKIGGYIESPGGELAQITFEQERLDASND